MSPSAGHLLARLLAGGGVHEEILEEHLRITGRGSATLVVVVALDVDGRGHRSERIAEGSSLAVGLGDAVALGLGCQDDEHPRLCFRLGTGSSIVPGTCPVHPSGHRNRIPESVSRSIRRHRTVGDLFLHIGRSPSGSCLLDVSGGQEIGQSAFDGGEADVRAGLRNLLLGNLARGTLDNGLDALRLGYLAITEVLNTVLKFIVGLDNEFSAPKLRK